MLAHGAGWTMLNTQHWSGCHGSTHLAYSNRSAIFRQRSTKRSFKSSVRNSRSQRRRLEHSNNRASDKPGTIHSAERATQCLRISDTSDPDNAPTRDSDSRSVGTFVHWTAVAGTRMLDEDQI